MFRLHSSGVMITEYTSKHGYSYRIQQTYKLDDGTYYIATVKDGQKVFKDMGTYLDVVDRPDLIDRYIYGK